MQSNQTAQSWRYQVNPLADGRYRLLVWDSLDALGWCCLSFDSEAEAIAYANDLERDCADSLRHGSAYRTWESCPPWLLASFALMDPNRGDKLYRDWAMECRSSEYLLHDPHTNEIQRFERSDDPRQLESLCDWIDQVERERRKL
ncbi:hypothetical protein NG796_16875 [Laspinema sp. A4]|uniref:hypothetical protein n=1 Tax=Laspinema sp. D2d TaxID=2953686 RepID=UPI0021BB6421|nr:hypothetical protein [Laspinema sp. D2d]MCT7984947.1 hypothetical protein [Laspinema sp. D2d]